MANSLLESQVGTEMDPRVERWWRLSPQAAQIEEQWRGLMEGAAIPVALSSFLAERLASGGSEPVCRRQRVGSVADIDALVAEIREAELQVVLHEKNAYDGVRWIMSSTDSVVEIRGRNEEVHVDVLSNVEAKADTLVLIAAKHVSETVHGAAGPTVGVIGSSHSGLSIHRIGNAVMPLERQNYALDVLKAFDRAVDDLRSSAPSGRIVIVEGPPGTGKTFLIRGLMAATQNEPILYVLLPPSMIESVTGPTLLPLLTRQRRRHRAMKSIVLVIEDADSALVQRMGDNMPSVSALLNLGDGIVGGLLDIRIVATTNARKTEFDPAILRPGRLSARIALAPLSADGARAVFLRLTDKDLADPEPMALAEVYARAREHGYTPPPMAAAPLGTDDDDDDGDYRYVSD